MTTEQSSGASRTQRILASCAILAVLALQITVELEPHRVLKRLHLGSIELRESLRAFFVSPHLYPFLSYPMYSMPRAPDAELSIPSVYATLDDGREVPIDLEAFPTFWIFLKHFVEGIRTGDETKIRALLPAIEHELGARVHSLRLERRRVRWREPSAPLDPPETEARLVLSAGMP